MVEAAVEVLAEEAGVLGLALRVDDHRRVLGGLRARFALAQSLPHLPQLLCCLPQGFADVALLWKRALVTNEQGLLRLVLISETLPLDLLELLELVVADLVTRLRRAVLAVMLVLVGVGTQLRQLVEIVIAVSTVWQLIICRDLHFQVFVRPALPTLTRPPLLFRAGAGRVALRRLAAPAKRRCILHICL